MTEIKTDTEGKKPLKSIKIKVTKETIDNAVRCDGNTCMVAEAIHQKYPDASYIWVDTSIIRFTRNGVRYWFLPPEKVKTAIMNFDDKIEVLPFDFNTSMLVRAYAAGKGSYKRTHPNGDNRIRPFRKYTQAGKTRKYGIRTRVRGVCQWVPRS